MRKNETREVQLKQVIQDLRNGKIEVADVPAPQVGRGKLLIRTSRTLISAGTERMLMEFGEASWLNKARQQPDKVRMVIDKIGTDGLIPTYQAVRDKLDTPMPLGYCHVGVVTAVGSDVTGFKVGDRVISNGNHGEIVAVPVNLCAKVPDAVSDEEASFTVLAAIALQGVRLADPTLGECFVVTGLGLIGLLAAQLLKANGCRVLGLDFDDARLALGREYGIETYKPVDDQDLLNRAASFSRGRGVDGVLIAAATESNAPLLQAAQMCRKKGRVVLIGVTGSQFSRTEFFKKEISFQVSCSYGPGRYDLDYEEKGIDYPVGYVRWTEGRNFEAVLDMIAEKKLDTKSLVTHRFEIEKANEAYSVISGEGRSLGVILEYPDHPLTSQTLSLPKKSNPDPNAGTGAKSSSLRVAVIGAGNHSSRTLLPAFREAGAELHTVVTSRGLTAMHAAKKFGFEFASTDLAKAWSEDSGPTVVIATRHSQHASMTLSALKSGKNVFVEKPVVVTDAELLQLKSAYESLPENERPLLTVGFNRRMSPLTQKMKRLLEPLVGPKVVTITVNAGSIPSDHWTQSVEEGRRLIGEGCHFIDLARYIVGAPIVESTVMAAEPVVSTGNREDHFIASLKFADGSVASIQYLANGHRAFPKERIDVFCQGKVLEIDNFKKLTGFGFTGFSKMALWSQDKGQKALAKAFMKAVQGDESQANPTPWNEVVEVAEVCLSLSRQLREAR